MNQLKNFRFVVLSSLMIATALPLAAKPGPDDDCDGAGGEIAMQGALTVQSISPLSSCVTQTELSGGVVVASRLYTPRGTSGVEQEKAEFSLTITSITNTLNDGTVVSVCMAKGTVKFFNETKGFGRMMDVSGVISPDGQFTGTMEGKKGLNAVNVKQAVMAGISGYFNPKEITVDKAIPFGAKGHSYVGTVTIVK